MVHKFALFVLFFACFKTTEPPGVNRIPDASPPPDALLIEYPQERQEVCTEDSQCVTKKCFHSALEGWSFCSTNCYSDALVYICHGDEVCVGDGDAWKDIWCYRACSTQGTCPDGQFCYLPPGSARGYCWLGDIDDYRPD